MNKQELKARFISYATRHIDTQTIRKQASAKFEKEWKINNKK